MLNHRYPGLLATVEYGMQCRTLNLLRKSLKCSSYVALRNAVSPDYVTYRLYRWDRSPTTLIRDSAAYIHVCAYSCPLKVAWAAYCIIISGHRYQHLHALHIDTCTGIGQPISHVHNKPRRAAQRILISQVSHNLINPETHCTCWKSDQIKET